VTSTSGFNETRTDKENLKPLNIEAISLALLRLDLAVYSPLRGVLADYVRYYGIDFEKEFPEIRHYLGWFEAYGYRLAGHVFLPQKATQATTQKVTQESIQKTKGTVFIVHGYLDHSGLYANIIRGCLERGYAVFIFDLPGHGLSSGDRADIPDFSHYQCVLESVLEKYGDELPHPFYAVGQSTGGGILMDHVLSACAKNKPPAFHKVLLLAPLLRPAQWLQIRFGYWLIHWLKKSVPRVFRRNSSDENFLRFLREDDPLQERIVPMGWVGALKQWVNHMLKLPRSEFPVLLVQGERDETVDWRYNIQFVRRHFHVEGEWLLPEASHQLANEREDLRAPVHTALAQMLL
jgi:alpha-beta hydrolase superfamily lysophospholipase